MSRTSVQRITIDTTGVARIAGSRSRVSQIVADRRQLSPEEIVDQYPHLSIEDVQAALAYYDGHREEIDAEIEEGARLYEEGLAKQRSDPKFQAFVQELRRRWAERQ